MKYGDEEEHEWESGGWLPREVCRPCSSPRKEEEEEEEEDLGQRRLLPLSFLSSEFVPHHH